MDYKVLVKMLREKLVMSQQEFADFLGVSFTSVSRWENGHSVPTFKIKRKLLQLCEEHGLEID